MDEAVFDDYVNVDEGKCIADYPTDEDILATVQDEQSVAAGSFRYFKCDVHFY
jgi:hypothetical protein